LGRYITACREFSIACDEVNAKSILSKINVLSIIGCGLKIPGN